MENKIQFNAAIYPKVMSIIIGKPYNKMKTIVMKWCQNLWWIFHEVHI